MSNLFAHLNEKWKKCKISSETAPKERSSKDCAERDFSAGIPKSRNNPR